MMATRNWLANNKGQLSVRDGLRTGLICVAALALSGCLGTGMSAVDAAAPTVSGQRNATLPPNPASQPASQNVSNQNSPSAAKPQEATGVRANIEKKVRENYLPSQIGHSIRELNVDNSRQNYPVIADPEQQERRLLTEEERKRIEEELRSLSDG